MRLVRVTGIMDRMKNKNKIILSLAVCLSIGTYFAWNKFAESQERQLSLKKKALKKQLKKELTDSIVETKKFPRVIEAEKGNYFVDYSIDFELQKYIEKTMKRYRTAFSSIVVMDNKTGKILAMTGMEKGKKVNLSLPLSTTHPSASLIKIVTMADLLENAKLSNSSVIPFNGKGTTLYKYQLKNKNNRWTRWETLERAFAKSNNVVFGKAAIYHSNGDSLYETANKFGFNNKVVSDINLSSSIFKQPENQYHLAELASGFNKETLISPIHAVMLSQVIANDGILVRPSLTNSLIAESGKAIKLHSENKKRVISKETANSLEQMMVETVKRGTARGMFRRLRRSLKSKLVIGAKTGSITGGIPFGKRDWISVFAREKQGDSGISVAVMNVNVKKWYVKSNFLAQKIIEFYFSPKRKGTQISKLDVASSRSDVRF